MDKEMDVLNQKVDDVPETVITIRLDEDRETEKSRIGGEQGNSDKKGNGSKGNEDLKKGDDFSCVIDVKCDGKLGEDFEGESQRVCRISHLSTNEAEKSRIGGEEGNSGRKGNGSGGSEVKEKDLKRGVGEDFDGDCQRVCRIYELSTYEAEKSRIGDEEGNSDMKGNVSGGNEVKVKELKKGDDFSTVIDVKCDGKLGEDFEGETQRVCRICHLSTYEADEKNLVDLIELGCGCKGELGFVHSHCAEAWFKLKGNRVCEICGEVAQSVTGVSDNRFIEEWNDTRSTASGTGSTETTRGCWRGQPFCNFLMACLVISFVLPWFFRVNMF
ncbi:uncharacterized protein LOC132036218 isoform X1 [Lycium ferocissimum]|uniref:uncharacterized protein LOC132036218 isoform X1 n=1 Tax=Lycium ferocissimum TaxID=112874 RepID=UPI0028168839|nr:uncharacterized protein LOC132036218 isoform X1 [Lycium ferocissimum]